MGFKQTANNGGGNFEACPAGSHAAVLVAIIDLGTQDETFNGEAKKQHKVFLGWEIPEEKKSDGSSHVIGREYTLSFHEKAGLRQLIESWRGKPFANGEDFDMIILIGKPCMLTIITEDKDGKTFSKIKAVGQLPKGMAKPVPTIKPVTFSLDDDAIAAFPDESWLPWSFGSKLIDIAKLSPEWKAKEAAPARAPKPETVPPTNEDADEAPF